MGQAKGGLLCCTSQANEAAILAMGCCSKGNSSSSGAGASNEIVQAKPDYEGCSPDGDDGILKPGDLAKKVAGGDQLSAYDALQGIPADPNGADAQEVYEDGSTYVGQILDGRRHGRGIWSSASEKYTGQWRADQRNGLGKQTWEDGRVFEGEFVDGMFHGRGRMEWHTDNGLMVYDGEYISDVKHGHGKYVWPDGRVYDGGWVDGKRHGKSKYTNKNGEVRVGIWEDDKIVRWLDASSSQSAEGDAKEGGAAAAAAASAP
eukprot:TRINITY_DN122629_c0_g1_i1.p1 TRINITY_DN122629_c0_g1~~TRINITY_DN122629_c0_g1_i1.p1  ORF type:complete len:261 (-),score=69.04 TRINITY_DN122629_c0_g1_i1:156-938(-)